MHTSPLATTPGRMQILTRPHARLHAAAYKPSCGRLQALTRPPAKTHPSERLVYAEYT